MTITNRDALRRAIRDPTVDPGVCAVLRLRSDQPGVIFHVVQPGDTLADAEAAIGWPLVDEGEHQWEWAIRHPGGGVEITFVLSDDGPAEVLLVPDVPEIDAKLLSLCR